MKNHKPILINMPLDLLHKLDDAATQLSLCRSELIRRCLKRDLTFIAHRQLHRFNEASQSTMHDYAYWSSTIINETKEE
ncbi:MAG: metal-responsive CopG/Arc/MetJ family transcriptional regulator [Hyphomicrobiaceae bacterium]|jgi:metal-responsive CopG/Arc/MetJ family transcriptional regulator